MLHPSYTDLMKVVNSDVEPGETNIVNSRYSIVMATSKRARQIIGGDEPLVNMKTGMKPLSVAVEELNEGKIKILGDEETEERNGGREKRNCRVRFSFFVKKYEDFIYFPGLR